MTPAQNSPERQSLSSLALVGALLLALAGLSYGLSFVALGELGLPIALAIAACKALTVLFVFMEFGGLPTSAKLAAGAALLMVALLVGLMVADIATREHAPLPPPRTSLRRRGDTTAHLPTSTATRMAPLMPLLLEHDCHWKATLGHCRGLYSGRQSRAGARHDQPRGGLPIE